MGFLKTRGLAIVLGAAGLTLAAAPAATAAVAEYHPDAESRTFATTDGGWVGSDSYTNGLCFLAPITCPTVDHSYVASGGAGGEGDGFLRASVGGIAGVASGTLVAYQSPDFNYDGVAGEVPDRLRLTLDQRIDAEALLQLLPEADFSVFLDNADTGTSIRVIDRAEIANLPEWSSIGSVAVDPDQLEVGSKYRIRLVVELAHPAAVIPDATFDYDNVVLRAVTGVAADTAPCQGSQALEQRGTAANDKLIGTGERDTLSGEGGDDDLRTRAAKDCASGGPGDDSIRGGAGPDLIDSGPGRDESKGAGGKDEISGGADDDRLTGGPGRDLIKGGDGDDKVQAADFRADTIRCGSGEDKAKVDPRDKVSASCERVKVRKG